MGQHSTSDTPASADAPSIPNHQQSDGDTDDAELPKGDTDDAELPKGDTDDAELPKGDTDDAELPKLAPSHSLSPTRHSHTSGQYLCWHQRLIFITSMAVGLIAIAIQYVLESGKRRSNAGFMRPGWARHRSDGLQFQHDR